MVNPITLKDKEYGLVIASLMTIISIIFFFSRSNGLISESYYTAFFPITIGALILTWLVVAIIETKTRTNKIFFFNEKRYQVPFFENTSIKIMTGLLLAVFFAASAIGLGSAIIDIPQPFNQESFSQVTAFDKFYYQAIHPGFVEELGIFLLVSVLSYIIILLFNFKRLGQIILAYIISSGIGAGVLTQAHRIVYGSDSGAYLGVFIFEWVVQFFNMLTGSFISWIPHIAHNGVVALNFLVAFSIGGVALLGHYFIIRRIQNE